MYAVINDSGTQIKVEEGDIIRIDLKDKKAGDEIEFTSVDLLSNGDQLLTNKEELENVKVLGKVLNEIKADKIIVTHYKRKKHSTKTRQGHRQKYLEVKIESIVA
ncbi:MAG: 50S ribosomal protein L21 [Planctomycetota bacterium]|nr:MAG: 50S ribosomal protein L21 [Planctomycetota bacterium]